MGRMTLRLHPVDVLMFRETRYFAEATADSKSEFPLPKTMAGAVRALMMRAAGVDFRAVRRAMKAARDGAADEDAYLPVLKQHLAEVCEDVCRGTWPVDALIRGPFLWHKDTRWYPLPRSIVKTKGDNNEPVAMRPALDEVPGWDGAAGSRPLVTGTSDATEAWEETFLSEEALREFLNGIAPGRDTVKEGKREEFITDEPRVGIAIAAGSGTADEGRIYSSTFMRLQPKCALDVDVVFAGEVPQGLSQFVRAKPWLRIGGEGGAARVEVIPEPAQPVDEPQAEGNPLVYLATPALFTGDRWYPGDATPLAAAVGSPKVFSGWDLAANLPMKTRYAVPAGSVFFYDENAAELPTHATCISDDEDDNAAGWGYCFRGVWS